MKETPNKYHTPGSHNLKLPLSTKETKDRFYKFASNKLGSIDFCTEFGGLPGFCSQKTYSSILWTLKNVKGGVGGWKKM